jgi:hypothetical protein
MGDRDLLDVLERYPELQAGLTEHADEVARIAARILELEANPPVPPVLPPDAPAWERDFWSRRLSAQNQRSAA